MAIQSRCSCPSSMHRFASARDDVRCSSKLLNFIAKGALKKLGRVPASIGLWPRSRRGLRDHGVGFGDDLPGDAADQFRARRNGDVLDLFRMETDGPGRTLLVRLPRDRRRLVHRRGGDRAPDCEALRRCAHPRLGDRVHRAEPDLQFACRMALRLFGRPRSIRRSPDARGLARATCRRTKRAPLS